MNNPFLNRDLHTQLLFPTLSWSSFSAFRDYDKRDWYKKYVLGERGEINPAMSAGIIIGEKLATDPTYLPEVPRPEIYEHNIALKFGDITLTGHIDGWSPSSKELLEYKTTASKTKWTEKSVKEHQQIDFYCLLLYLKDKIRPEEIKIRLVSIPVSMSGDFKVDRNNDPIEIIPTSRTLMEVLNFGVELKRVYKQMKEYVDKPPL